MSGNALPADLHEALDQQLGSRVARATPVGGGCISTVLRLELADGARAFLKLAPEGPPGGALLEAERIGLAALRATDTVRVPGFLAAGSTWLLLEWLEPGRGSAQAWEELGRRLARLHRVRSTTYGFDHDNYIGSLAQANPALSSWPRFWWEARLEPQLALARRAGLADARLEAGMGRLRERLEEVLEGWSEEGASLLHGDLWSGNVHLVRDGVAALIDPSVYRGHREVDLAMASLFGGFDAAFWRSYEEEWPLLRAGLERRRAAYQLYYLLVHVNLFGAGYLGQTLAALGRALA